LEKTLKETKAELEVEIKAKLELQQCILEEQETFVIERDELEKQLVETKTSLSAKNTENESIVQVSLYICFRFSGGLEVLYTGVLVVSCFKLGTVLDSCGVLLSYSIVSLSSPMTNILISNLKH